MCTAMRIKKIEIAVKTTIFVNLKNLISKVKVTAIFVFERLKLISQQALMTSLVQFLCS